MIFNFWVFSRNLRKSIPESNLGTKGCIPASGNPTSEQKGAFPIQNTIYGRAQSVRDWLTPDWLTRDVCYYFLAPPSANPMVLRKFSGFIGPIDTSKKCVTPRFSKISTSNQWLKQHKETRIFGLWDKNRLVISAWQHSRLRPVSPAGHSSKETIITTVLNSMKSRKRTDDLGLRSCDRSFPTKQSK